MPQATARQQLPTATILHFHARNVLMLYPYITSSHPYGFDIEQLPRSEAGVARPELREGTSEARNSRLQGLKSMRWTQIPIFINSNA